ncbi:MAG: heme biosynthesis protein HemY [Deltaproteobacteria bacterium]|nr:heme biosynthesis protein HemY [Deltaproteobacteria bacterium]
MKLILTAIAALIIATGLAYQVHLDPGYALLTYGEFSIETSLAVLIFMSLLLFISFYIALRTLLTVKQAPKNIGIWNTKRKQLRSTKALNLGLVDSAEGNWQRSEKLLLKHAKQSDTPLLNYLSAAHAAQSQGAYNRRDDYLFKAGEALPEQIHAIHLTRAKLQLAAGQLEQAFASLQQLRTATPGHPVVLSLLLKTHLRLKDWRAIFKLLPAIKNNRKIAAEQWQSVEQQTLLALLNEPEGQTESELDSVWNSLDKKQKLSAQFLAPYASNLIRHAKDSIASELLVKAINGQLNEQLLGLYWQLNIDANKKEKQVNKWLKNHPQNTTLINTLAQLHFDQGHLDKAISQLEKSLAIKPSSPAFLLLGKTYEQQAQASNKIQSCYKQGLELSLNAHSSDLQ